MFEPGKTAELLKTNIKDLVPSRLLQVARNPENIDVRSLRGSDDELDFVIIESDYGGQTNEEDWNAWLEAIALAKDGSENPSFIIQPTPPDGVNRLHAKFMDNILDGQLLLTDRVLLSCRLRIEKDGDTKLIVIDYDGEKGLGAATEFYTIVLPTLAKKLGIRFIVGQNSRSNKSFFTEKLGRYTYWQLKPEAIKKLFPGSNSASSERDHETVQFLYAEDVEEYVLKEEIKS